MDEVEINKATFIDNLVKGAVTLAISALVTTLVDNAYDKYIIERRNKPVET